MPAPRPSRSLVCACLLAPVGALSIPATAQPTPLFIPGNVIVAVEGCGIQGGTCTSVPNGSGTGAGNSSSGGYGDNQAAPLTLFQFKPSGAASASYVNSLVLPQAASGQNLPIAGEYGSSSEAMLQLSGAGQYLTLGAYGINAAVFDATPTVFGAAPSNALAQSGSLTGQSYTPIARIVALIDPFGNVNSSTALFNIYNTNNPRSVYTFDGKTVYLSGQGSGSDATGGVFLSPLFMTNNTPTSITGLDTSTNTLSQDTRDVQIFNNTLYVSVDSKEGSGATRDFLGTLGTPPATSLFAANAGPTELNLANNAATPVAVSSNGKITLTAGEINGLNSAGLQVNLSPSGFFFANPSTLYIADTGNSKQTSANSLLGDGGLQKWTNTKPDGSGTWQLMYTIAAGLNLVQNPSAKTTNVSGTTGLYSVTGTVSGDTVNLYAVNATIADLDPTFLYGFTDSLAATTNPGTPLVQLAAAPPDSNFKGVAMAPTLPAGGATITSLPSGFSVTTSGTGCAPGTYITPVTLVWTPGSTCQLTTTSPQTSGAQPFVLSRWQDGTTGTTDTVTAPATAAVYTATFTNNFQPVGALEKAIDSTTSSSTVLQGDSLLVSGWAGDPVDGSPLGNVKVYIDGNLFGTPTLDIPRPDVAAAFGPAFANSGYQLIASAASLPLGSHAVTVIAIDSNARSTTFGPLNINVTSVSQAQSLTFVADTTRVQTFTAGGLPASQFQIAANGRFPFGPGGLAVDHQGDSFLTDVANKSVSEFDSNGVFLRTFGSFGTGDGQFANGISGIAVDPSDNVLVADTGNDRVERFSNTGVFLGQFGTRGHDNGQFVAPVAIATDPAGDLFVADSSRVQEFTNTGQFLQQFAITTNGAFQSGPGGLAIDAKGDLLLTDISAKDVTEFDTNGKILQVIGSFGSGNGQFLNGLNSVAIDPSGNLLAADPGNHRIESFTPGGVYQSQFGAQGSNAGQFNNGSLFVAVPR